MNITNISIIGAGTMGNGIAHTFALYGYKVNLIDVSEAFLEKGMNTIDHNLDRMIRKDTINKFDKLTTLKNITPYTSLENGVSKAHLVIEAASEDEEVKMNIFRKLNVLCPSHTILATNTSSISITKLAKVTTRPDKVIGMHFMNPVPILKLVEVIKGYNTSDKVLQTIMLLARKLNKVPLEVNDYPGFIANRIIIPMINEAIEALYTGVAGVIEIDSIMRLGAAQPMGPLQLADFIGLDICLSILNVMYDGFKNPKYAPCPLLVNMVNAGRLGIKSGEGFYDYSGSKKAERVSSQFST